MERLHCGAALSSCNLSVVLWSERQRGDGIRTLESSFLGSGS